MTRAQLATEHAAKTAALSAILSLGDDISLEKLEEGEALKAEITNLKAQLDRFAGVAALQQAATDAAAFVATPHNPMLGAPMTDAHLVSAPRAGAPGQLSQPHQAASIIPATVVAHEPRNFKARNGQTGAERAYQFGMWFLATSGKSQRARQYCGERGIQLLWQDRDNNIVQLAHAENVSSTGGFLVPPQLEADLIDLREEYGVARQLLRNRTMRSDTLTIPRRTGGLTAYWVTDNEAITESTKGWDNVTLTAKKIGCLAKTSSELSEDAIIDMMDDLASEISYAFVFKEDECAFNGDGTSTYGGIQGLRSKLSNIDGAGTASFGLVSMTGNLWSELTLADFHYIKGKLPKYAKKRKPVWVCSEQFRSAVIERLMLAAGGITDAMIAAGVEPRFLGYPVVTSQSMPTAEADSTVSVLLGAFQLAASFGDRRQTTIAMSEHSSFANDQTDIRGTERFDIVVHEAGTSTVAGPYVGGKTIT